MFICNDKIPYNTKAGFEYKKAWSFWLQMSPLIQFRAILKAAYRNLQGRFNSNGDTLNGSDSKNANTHQHRQASFHSP